MLPFIAAALITLAQAEPTPPPALPPTCPYVSARVKTPVVPNYPDSVRDLQVEHAQVLLYVSLDAQGHPVEMGVLQSSGYTELDMAAERAAAHSTYIPAQENCAAVAGYYEFRADFDMAGYHAAAVQHPNFPVPPGWARAFGGLTFAPGARVGAWSNGPAELAITAFTDDGRAPLQNYLPKTTDRPAPDSVGPATACNGTQQAASATLDFTLSKVETLSLIMRAVRSGRMVYTLTYSVPKGDAFDPAMLAALDAFCGPDRLNGVS
jgi:TonB family protein